jgi:hypothetical protein
MFDSTKKALKSFIQNNFNMQKLSLDDKKLEDRIMKHFLYDLSIFITSQDRKKLPDFWLTLKPDHINFI